MTELDTELASRCVRLTLGHIGHEYPNKLDHVMAGPEDVASPSALHPIFYGSFDWQSCVHGWWQLMRLVRLFPNLPKAAVIRERADAMLVCEKVAGEFAYLNRPASAGFERPYGWAWLLALHDELTRHDGHPWSDALAPLARAFAGRLSSYLPKLTYPIRTGTHVNTSFSLVLVHDWAVRHDPSLARLIHVCARNWFASDRGCQVWEPGGDDFLSPALSEALLMSRILPRSDFTAWLDGFLPDLAEGRPATLFTPTFVADRSDGKIVHLDGLNLSRAWCWRSLAVALGRGSPLTPLALAAAEKHIAASLPHLAEKDGKPLAQVNPNDEGPQIKRLSIDCKATVKIGEYAHGGKTRGEHRAADHDMGCEEKYVPFGVVDEDSGRLHLTFGSSFKTSDFIPTFAIHHDFREVLLFALL